MRKISLLILVVGVLFSFGQSVFCAENTYVVQKGDSINRIAGKYKILSWQLRAANGLGVRSTLLHPGQKLTIPVIQWKSYEGRASWYGPGFHGKKMANGEIYNQNDVLIAHRTLPLGLKVLVTNLETSKSIIARVLDRGPYTKKNGRYDREVDLSYGAAKILGALESGVIPVKITPL